MTKEEVMSWDELRILVQTGTKLGYWEYVEFLRLNQLIMEASHKIHNDNMLRKDK